MSKRFPSEFTPYNISDIVAKRRFKKNEQGVRVETFKAFGSDYSEQSGNIVYFTSIPVERTVAFKAFFDSIILSTVSLLDLSR